MKPKILLANWTHRHNIPGGTENRYQYLEQIFPDAELISHYDLFGGFPKDLKEAAEKMDKVYLERYEKDKNILIIRDAEVGGVLDISKIPQITIFGNPYISLYELFKYSKQWVSLSELQGGTQMTKKIAVSNFMVDDMKKNGLIPDCVIPNPVDIDFFKPLGKDKLREKYKIPKNKRIGMWVGATDTPIKNFEMIQYLINVFEDIFWILVSKNRTTYSGGGEKVRLFHDISKETMRDFYNCADFYILTSPIEGCNHTIFEAMSCDVPCIISKAGYFWDFWDKRIGFKMEYNNLLEHIGAVKIINGIPTSPRQVIIDQKLDFKSIRKTWEDLVNEYIGP